MFFIKGKVKKMAGPFIAWMEFEGIVQTAVKQDDGWYIDGTHLKHDECKDLEVHEVESARTTTLDLNVVLGRYAQKNHEPEDNEWERAQFAAVIKRGMSGIKKVLAYHAKVRQLVVTLEDIEDTIEFKTILHTSALRAGKYREARMHRRELMVYFAEAEAAIKASPRFKDILKGA